MFKVSFKETETSPSKVVMRAGNFTEVTLKGTIKVPEFWPYIPKEIDEWVRRSNHVEIYEDMAKGIFIIFVQGVSKCHPDDKMDNMLGERLAESRAKKNLYRFLFQLCDKLCVYYADLMGIVIATTPCDGGLTDARIKYLRLYNAECKHERALLNNTGNGK